jgi:hypothetical protein
MRLQLWEIIRTRRLVVNVISSLVRNYFAYSVCVDTSFVDSVSDIIGARLGEEPKENSTSDRDHYII